MTRFAHGLIRWRWAVLALLLGSTVLALFGVARLRVDPSNERLFPQQGSDAVVYQRFRDTFGSDEELLVALYAPQQEILSAPGLLVLRQLTKDLAALPSVAAVHSLVNAPDLRQLALTPFGIAVPRLLGEEPPTPERIAVLQHHEQVLGTLLSPDLHTAGLIVVPHEAVSRSAAAREAWIIAVRAVAAQHAVQGWQTYVAGTPLERSDVTHYIQRDQRLMIPLVLLVLLGVTYSIYRVKRFAVVALACVGLSLTWTMGIVGFLGVPLNVITALLPAVILVVSVSVVIHLLNQFSDVVTAAPDHATAVVQAVGQVGTACVLTTLTTAMGFLSLPVIQAPAIQEFGLFAGLGVLLACVAAMTFVPLALLWIGPIPAHRLTHLTNGRFEAALGRLAGWVAQHRRTVGLGALFLVLLMLPGIWQITEGTDIIRALHKHAPLRVSSEFIDQHLTGAHALELLVQLPEDTAGTAPQTIRAVLALAHWLRAQPGVTAVVSPWEPLRSVRAALLVDDDQLKVLATLLPLGLPLSAWLDATGKVLRLSARVTSMDSERVLALAQHISQHAAETPLRLHVTGSHYLLAQMSRVLVRNQVSSLLLAVVMILGTIALALRSWKMGLVAAVPNLLPTLMIFGLMGWLGIELSTATTMIASVALGLFVDDTIHLLYLYTQRKHAGEQPVEAVAYALRHAGRAVIFTALTLTLGFWSGLLGSFKPTLHFSFLMGLTMLLSVVTELLVTPAAVLVLEGVPRGD